MTSEIRATDCYDNSELSLYKSCPRSYFIRYILGWRTEGTSPALVFGGSWHEGMDIIWGYARDCSKTDLRELAMEAFMKHWSDGGMPECKSLEEQEQLAPRTPGTAREMYANYIEQRWNMLHRCEVIAVEQPIAIPMPGMPGKFYIGKLDKVVEYNGQVLVLEHKTTSAYAINGQFQPYFTESWDSAAQVKGYEVAANLYYGKIDAVWVDAALVHKKVHDAFKFIPISHKTELLEGWLENTREWIRRVEADKAAYAKQGNLEGGIFPVSEENCWGKYGPNPFLNLISTVRDPSQLKEVPAGYVYERWEPFNKLGLNEILNKQHNEG